MRSLAPFEGARLKITRAAIHIDELDSAIAAYLARRPAAIVVEQPVMWVEFDSYAWVARLRQPVPTELAAIIGDAVHNLRASLDLLATDLVRLNGQSTRNVHFPFASNAGELQGQIKQKGMSRAAPHVVELVRQLQPYTGGNVALRGLHDLDLRDKHQALIPVIAAACIPPAVLDFRGSSTPIPEWRSAIPHDGFQMVILPRTKNMAIGCEVPATFTVVFPKDTPLASLEVVPALRELHRYVGHVVDQFAALCEGQCFPTLPSEWTQPTA
ncbi:hypothetical protein [Falsiroseomonas sp.]|uniref:hypothetical protein n=1 Tax=Falsiroseomonas sp. TaxID=2870721 RepID=UPI003F6FE737